MSREKLWDAGFLVLLIFALALIFVPRLREIEVLRLGFVVLYIVIAGASTFREYRAGHLSVPLSELKTRRLRTSPLSFLATVIGTVALVLVL